MRDVFRPWPGALRDSNYRTDRRTSCARSINYMPTPLSGDDPRSAGGRRRQYFLAPTPGVETNPLARNWIPKHPPRAFISTPDAMYAVAGAARGTDPGTLYRIAQLRVTAVSAPAGASYSDGQLAGAVTETENSRNWPPLCQMAWGGPQVGIVAVVGNGKLGYYDERTSEWHNDVFGTAGFPSGRTAGQQANVVGVAFFQNYFFVLDDENRLFASPLLARNTTAQGALQPTTREGANGQISRYAFDLTQVVQRSLEPDPWVAVWALSDRLLLFGEQSMGVWELKADPEDGFPLERPLGGQHEVGVFGAGGIASVGDHAYWVGRSPDGQTRAWRFGGEEGVEPISTPAVDEYLANVSGLARVRARCTATAIAGRRCFAMRLGERQGNRFNRLDATWCYDETTGMWHERGVWNPNRDGRNKGGWNQWEIVFSAPFEGSPYVIAEDAYNGYTLLGFLTTDPARGDGENVWADAILTGKNATGTVPTSFATRTTPTLSGIIRRERITPHWGTRAALQSVKGVRVSMGSGGGEVLLSLSADGGVTYVGALSGLSRTPKLRLGGDVLEEELGELTWYALGMARDPVVRLQMVGKSAALNNVWANVQRLRN